MPSTKSNYRDDDELYRRIVTEQCMQIQGKKEEVREKVWRYWFLGHTVSTPSWRLLISPPLKDAGVECVSLSLLLVYRRGYIECC